MDSALELLYDIIKNDLPSNPQYERARAQWAAIEPILPLETADTVNFLKEEWGLSCFAAGLMFRSRLERELGQL